MLSTEEFQALISRVRAGDQDAATTFAKQYEPLIRREVRMRLEDRRLGRLYDSMDICQSVLASFFVRTTMGAFELQDSKQLVALLVSMTRNKVASAARKQQQKKRDQRRVVDLDLATPPGNEATPSRIASARELLVRTRELLRPDERLIADLRSDGYSWEEIANRMGGTAQARRVQFSRAVVRVERELGINSTFS